MGDLDSFGDALKRMQEPVPDDETAEPKSSLLSKTIFAIIAIVALGIAGYFVTPYVVMQVKAIAAAR